MRKLFVFGLLFFSLNANAGVIGQNKGVDLGFSESQLNNVAIYQRDMVHQYIKNRQDCGQQEHIQKYTYSKYSTPTCVNMAVGLITVFSFDEPIESYVASDPKHKRFFRVGVWVSKEDHKDNMPRKHFYVKSLFPNKSANIVFLAESGREYHFDLKSISFKSNEIPTRSVVSQLSEDLKEEISELEKKKAKARFNSLIASARRINTEQDNDFVKYMQEIFQGRVNTHYEMESYKDGEDIKPFSVFDNGSRFFLNFDGILSITERPQIFKVINGVETPVETKAAYTIGPSFKGFIYVDGISQEGWTLRLGNGEKSKVLCIKPTVNLRKFHNQSEEDLRNAKPVPVSFGSDNEPKKQTEEIK
tara:strand:- start:2578 stop:3657 length:1080 start_codon:yes stop_codon:yes gene_type:complete